jgi:hypothetical protein
VPEDDQKPFPRRWASTGDHSAIDVCSRGRASTEIGLTGSFRGPLLTLVVASAVIAVAGCGLSDSGPCAIADGQEPLDGRTHEQVLEELSEPDSGWPEVPGLPRVEVTRLLRRRLPAEGS